VALFRKQSSKAIIPLGYVLTCLFFVLGRPAAVWTWYTIIPCLLLCWSAALALDRWVEAMDRRYFLTITSGSVALLLLAAVVGTKMRDSRLEVYGRPNVALADFIKTHTPNAKSYMCGDIGIPAFRLKIPVLDLAGLVSKEMLARTPSGDLLSYGALIKSKKPDIVALRADIFSETGYPEAFVYRRSFSSDPAEASQEAAYISENYQILRNVNPHFPVVLVSKSL
jgi:hypothetical protein